MKSSLYISTFLVMILSFQWGIAQPPTNDPLEGKDDILLENERIEDVIDSEKPFIKPPYQDLKKGDQDPVQFRSKDFYVETDFDPAPPDITPLAKERLDKAKNSYVRLGIGRFLTPVGELYINNGRKKDTDFGLRFTHISAHDDKLPLREFRRDHGTVQASQISKDYTLSGKVHFYNTAYWTAYNDSTVNDTSGGAIGPESFRDSLRMGFTRFHTFINLRSNSTSRSELHFDTGIGLKIYGDKRDNSEFQLSLYPGVGYDITENFSGDLESEITYIRGRIDDVGANRFFLDAAPIITFNNGLHSVRAGVRFNYFSTNADTASGTNFLGPVIQGRFSIIPDQFAIVAGFTSGMINNTYSDMIYINPYLNRNVDIRPSIEKMNIYAGIEGNISDQFDFAARVYYRQVADQLMFIPTLEDYTFITVYDSLLKNTGLHIELNYDLNEQIRAGGSFNFNAYNSTSFESFFNASPVRLDAYGRYTWDERLRIQADVSYFGRALTAESEESFFYRSPFFGVALGADFQIVEQFSAFAKVSNLVGTQFQRWYQYPERGIDFRVGFTLSF
ncbi:MAG: hypothetical protein AB8H47_23885 [Bacteroidia bacterium]